jgi:hypothetical protein
MKLCSFLGRCHSRSLCAVHISELTHGQLGPKMICVAQEREWAMLHECVTVSLSVFCHSHPSHTSIDVLSLFP